MSIETKIISSSSSSSTAGGCEAGLHLRSCRYAGRAGVQLPKGSAGVGAAGAAPGAAVYKQAKAVQIRSQRVMNSSVKQI